MTNARSNRLFRVARPVCRHGESGATTLEWMLLLGGVALASYFILKAALLLLVGHYQMMITLNAMPFP